MGQSLAIPRVIPNDWKRLDLIINKIKMRLGRDSSPTFVGLTLSGKVTSGSFGSPIDVTATRQYGFEIHYSGNDYDVTGIRSRAQLVTTDTTASAQGALLQAANNNGIDAGVLQGALIEAIGKSDGNAATIAVMRGCLVNTEWGDYDTVTNLKTLHVRTHSRNAAGAGSFGTGYGIYIENEAVGGNGQALDAGIYLKGTNLSAGNKAFTYGIDFTGATYGTSQINLIAAGSITMAGTQVIKFDDTNFNVLLGCDAFNNNEGQYNVGVGYQVGYLNDTTGVGVEGDYNTYIGYQTGYGAGGTNTGYYNVAAGYRSLHFNTTGNSNVAVGHRALYGNKTGGSNFALGFQALFGNIAGGHNIAIGTQALSASNTQSNIAIGSNALKATTGRDNTAIGFTAGFKNVAGKYNTAIGSFSMYQTVSGDENVIIGYQAGFGVSANSYSDNVFIGAMAGYSTTTGSQNIYLGYNSGYRQTTNSNRFIIDNRQRADANTELTNAILYGIMAATPADQTLRINAQTEVHGLVIQAIAKTGAYTLTAIDDFVECDASGGAFIITLPAVASTTTGKVYHIKKIDSSANVVTVDGNASETIDDGTTASITTQYECITIINNGSEWWIL